MSAWYKLLPDHSYVPMDIFKEKTQLGTEDARVARTKIKNGIVSTVFLALDHSHGGELPLVFETMVFLDETGMEDRDCERYTTWEQAVEGHKRMVEKWGGEVP